MMNAPRTPPRAKLLTPVRDQAPSNFTTILERLVSATPGAEAAALVDSEGETVDYAGRGDIFELKVAAAHWQLVMAELAAVKQLGGVRQLTVRAGARGYVIRRIEEAYAVVVILRPRAAFEISERAFQEAIVGLYAEVGWTVPRDAARWFLVDVETERRDLARPLRLKVQGGWVPIEVMGCVVGLRPREKGFRVRLPSGAEMTLIRERFGRWFADDHVG
jgi:predicted regulator of Ras-like GTPase activity (Roadblock/LC7/MglB family)